LELLFEVGFDGRQPCVNFTASHGIALELVAVFDGL
jgi:hypothetical protein